MGGAWLHQNYLHLILGGPMCGVNEYIFDALRVLSRKVTQSDCMGKIPLADRGLQNAEYRWYQVPRKGSDDADGHFGGGRWSQNPVL